MEGEENSGNEIEGYVDAEIAEHKMRLCIFPDDAEGVADTEVCEKQLKTITYLFIYNVVVFFIKKCVEFINNVLNRESKKKEAA